MTRFRVTAERTISPDEAKRRLTQAFDLILESGNENPDESSHLGRERLSSGGDPATSEQQDQGRLYHAVKD